MDDREEWAEPWPFWKFGLKQHDLHTSLHEKYNTFPSAIQDPEAFHHDVYELSTQASTRREFEELMEERKTQRLKELNTMLEDASFEIIGCPRLIGTEQWVHAVQLFRTKSLDSLVRYFASYLPDDHPWHHDSDSAVISSGSDATSPASPASPIDYDGPILFDEPEEDEAMYTNQPSESFSACAIPAGLSKRAMTGRSEDSGVSVNGRDQYLQDDGSRPPSRTMSCSGSENDFSAANLAYSMEDSHSTLHDSVSTSQSDDPETPSTSISDPGDVEIDAEAQGRDATMITNVGEGPIDRYVSITRTYSQTMDSMDSDTPTPKASSARSPATPATSFFGTTSSPLPNSTLLSNRSHPHNAHPNHIDHQENRKYLVTRQLRRREGSLERERKASVGARTSRARESSPEGTRSRARARRRRAGI